MLNREAILAQTTLKTEVVEIPEWGGSVIIRELTADEADTLGTAVRKDDRAAMLRWVVAATVDESGKPLFTEADKPALGKMGAAAIIRIGAAAVKLSRLGPDDDEEIRKN